MKWSDGIVFPKGGECSILFNQTNVCEITYRQMTKKLHVTKLNKFFNQFEPINMEELQEAVNDGVCQSICGETVEPDGYDEHGSPSWLLAMGLI